MLNNSVATRLGAESQPDCEKTGDYFPSHWNKWWDCLKLKSAISPKLTLNTVKRINLPGWMTHLGEILVGRIVCRSWSVESNSENSESYKACCAYHRKLGQAVGWNVLSSVPFSCIFRISLKVYLQSRLRVFTLNSTALYRNIVTTHNHVSSSFVWR